MDKFLGLGLKNLFGVLIFIMIGIVITKTILTKYPVKGVSEIVQAV